ADLRAARCDRQENRRLPRLPLAQPRPPGRAARPRPGRRRARGRDHAAGSAPRARPRALPRVARRTSLRRRRLGRAAGGEPRAAPDDATFEGSMSREAPSDSPRELPVDHADEAAAPAPSADDTELPPQIASLLEAAP